MGNSERCGCRHLVQADRSVPNTTNDHDQGFYSTDYYTKNLLNYFDQRTESEMDQPFFAYLPFAAPHWPLQCSPIDREKYQGMYKDGPGVLRQHRLTALMKKGFIKDDVIPHDVVSFGTKEWQEMSEREKQLSSRAMEVYAGMVECIDRNVGKVLDHLEKAGELDSE